MLVYKQWCIKKIVYDWSCTVTKLNVFIYAHYYVQNFVGINKNVVVDVNATLCKQKRNLISKRNKKLKTENKQVMSYVNG